MCKLFCSRTSDQQEFLTLVCFINVQLFRTMQLNIKCVFISFLFLSFLQRCTSNDNITQNQSFKDGDLLISSNNSFAFGFFSSGDSLYRYVGIWYNKISEQTVVWVANRDNPINGSHGVLSIENSGNIVLRDQRNNELIWSTNVSIPGSSVQLMENGDLVFYQSTQNGSIISWQSFDYPTDTFLPYMKDGVNKRTGLHWSLASWKSKDDPGTGDFLLNMVLNGSPQLFLYKNSEALWRSGPWNGLRWSGVPDMNTDFILVPIYVDNDDEVSISNSLRDPSIFTRLTLNEAGSLEMLTWQQGQHSWISFWSAPGDQCDYYSHCGSFSICDPYNLTGEFECQCLLGYEPKVKSEWDLRNGISGCTRNPGEEFCGNSTADVGFLKLTSVKVPDTRNAGVNKILGLNECADLCLSNCSCTAYSSANITNGGSGCITWNGDLIDLRKFSNGGQDLYVRVSASELAQYLKNQKDPNRKKWIIISVSSIAVLLGLIFAIILVVRKWKGRRHYIKKLLSFNLSPASVSLYQGTSRTKDIDEGKDLSIYDLKTIISATGSFAPANKLGEGGFGSVYKGWLQNGREIAVKRLSKSSGQGVIEFKNEVTLIARLQHRNLVKLLGCCIQHEEKMLVYEYLPNKGLDNFIFDERKAALLDWRKRFAIILGIARGLVYLHRDSRLKIIHRDLKSSNVLLDANMEPKISDFGMARMFGANQTEARTRRVVGTYGYMSPEYAMQGLFSEKSDVFSFGVLLLEIISGKKNNSYFCDNTLTLIGYVWELWKEGQALDIVDPAMGELRDEQDEVGRCILIGLLCVQEHAKDRPAMSQVLSLLCNETSVTSISPKKPAFVIEDVDYVSNNTPPFSPVADIGASVNNVTITALQAR